MAIKIFVKRVFTIAPVQLLPPCIAVMCFGKISSKIFFLNTQFPTKLVFPDMTLSVFRVRPDELAWPGPAPHHCASPNMLVHSPTCAACGSLYNPQTCLHDVQCTLANSSPW